MSDLTLLPAGLANGIWEGRLTAPDAATPTLAITHLGQEVAGVTLSALPDGTWAVRVPIPPAAIAEGMQTIVIADPADGTTLATICLLAGEALAGDLRSEISLLRAELDLLKRAFRRHAAAQG